MKNKLLIVGIAVMSMLTVFMLAMKLYKQEQGKNLALLSQDNFKSFVADHAPKMGAEDPEVYLVEFLDPECESCRDFYPYVKEILKEHAGKVQLVVRYAPFHGNSIFAVKVLEAARKQGKYWEALETLFKYQPVWGNHHEPKPELIWNYLPEAGVDVEQVRKDMNDPAIQEIIRKDMYDGEMLGVRATPTFFINGKMLEDFGLQQLKTAVQNALRK